MTEPWMALIIILWFSDVKPQISLVAMASCCQIQGVDTRNIIKTIFLTCEKAEGHRPDVALVPLFRCLLPVRIQQSQVESLATVLTLCLWQIISVCPCVQNNIFVLGVLSSSAVGKRLRQPQVEASKPYN
uniref:Secreted protein n=1 Tax=Rhipicephalus appendiculatus TaxID=34631 RepID=A0A131YF15_RHIAP